VIGLWLELLNRKGTLKLHVSQDYFCMHGAMKVVHTAPWPQFYLMDWKVAFICIQLILCIFRIYFLNISRVVDWGGVHGPSSLPRLRPGTGPCLPSSAPTLANPGPAAVVLRVLQVVSLVSVLFVVVSIVSFCLKTHHTMKIPVVRNTTYQRVPTITGDDVTCQRGVTSSREPRGVPMTS